MPHPAIKFGTDGWRGLIADDFTTDNGMLTPSLKLKRRKVIETYGPAIEQLYAARGDKAKKASAGARA